MANRYGDRNDERHHRDQQSWSPYERDERGDRERARDRERGGWESMDAARGDRGEVDDRYLPRWQGPDDRGRYGWRAGDRYGGYGYGFDRFGGGGGYAGERFEGPGGDRYGGRQPRYSGEGGQSGSQSGGHRGKGPVGYQRSDERIREEVSDLLTDDDNIDASAIEVQVAGGEVILTGHVPDRRTRRLIEDLLDRVQGVKDLAIQLKVQPDRQHAGNGGRVTAQSVTSAPDKDSDTSHRRPRA
jgi:hypothetical protein